MYEVNFLDQNSANASSIQLLHNFRKLSVMLAASSLRQLLRRSIRPASPLYWAATVRWSATSWQVSSHGRVRSPVGIASYGWSSDGYRRVKIQGKCYFVHRLVASTFLGPPPSLFQWQVNHIDGNKRNNDLSNLQYVSPSENASHYWASSSRRKPCKAGSVREPEQPSRTHCTSASEASRTLVNSTFASPCELKVTASTADLVERKLLEAEVWKSARAPGEVHVIPGLMVSNHGRVCSSQGRVSRGSPSSAGYYRLASRTGRSYLVHRLVAGTFLGPPTSVDMQVNHKDLNRKNNHVHNLEYVTQSQNIQHAYLQRKAEKQTRRGTPLEARPVMTNSPWLLFKSVRAAAAHTEVTTYNILKTCKRHERGGSCAGWEFRFETQDAYPGEEWRDVVLEGARSEMHGTWTKKLRVCFRFRKNVREGFGIEGSKLGGSRPVAAPLQGSTT